MVEMQSDFVRKFIIFYKIPVAFFYLRSYNICVKKITKYIKEMLEMSRFCLPRDVYHGKGCLEELKNLKGKKQCS